ncbi:MAG TPA: VOC family protein, partial [Acidimicrobiales bacterium]|nr:VOC family protein [Acidimicrobiales bacterium]
VIRDPFGHRWMVVTERAEPGTGPGGVEPVPAALHHGDLGYVSLWVPDAGRAAAFFAAVLGWTFEQDGGDPASPRRVAGHRLHHGLVGGVDEATLFCCYAVEDADAAAERIRAAGGTTADPRDEPYGRVVDATDPEGMRFAVFTPPGGALPRRGEHRHEDAPNRGDRSPRQGDVVYVTMEVHDSARTRSFYGAVLGWEASPGRVEDGWNVEGVSPMFGIAGGQPQARCVPMYQVDDVHAAVARVRAAGGRATDPEVQPYGVTSDATDDQGTRFYLGQLGPTGAS